MINIKQLKFIVILCLFFSQPLSSQDDWTGRDTTTKANTIYLELLGSSQLYSINYDRLLFQKNKKKFTANIGLMYLPFGVFNKFGNTGSNVQIPFSFNYLCGKKHSFISGVGFTFQNYNMKESYILPLVQMGYRFQNSSNGFFFQSTIIGFVHYFEYPLYYNYPIKPWLSFGFGRSF